MVHAKNDETVSTFVEFMQKKTVASFFLDTVYSARTLAPHPPFSPNITPSKEGGRSTRFMGQSPA